MYTLPEEGKEDNILRIVALVVVSNPVKWTRCGQLESNSLSLTLKPRATSANFTCKNIWVTYLEIK